MPLHDREVNPREGKLLLQGHFVVAAEVVAFAEAGAKGEFAGHLFAFGAAARHEEVDRDIVVEGILHVFDAGGVEAFHAFGLGERFEGVEGRRIRFGPLPNGIRGIDEHLACEGAELFGYRNGNVCGRGDHDHIRAIGRSADVGDADVGEDFDFFDLGIVGFPHAEGDCMAGISKAHGKGISDISVSNNRDFHAE